MDGMTERNTSAGRRKRYISKTKKQLKPMPIFEIIVLVAVLALTLYFGRDYMNDDY